MTLWRGTLQLSLECDQRLCQDAGEERPLALAFELCGSVTPHVDAAAEALSRLVQHAGQFGHAGVRRIIDHHEEVDVTREGVAARRTVIYALDQLVREGYVEKRDAGSTRPTYRANQASYLYDELRSSS